MDSEIKEESSPEKTSKNEDVVLSNLQRELGNLFKARSLSTGNEVVTTEEPSQSEEMTPDGRYLDEHHEMGFDGDDGRGANGDTEMISPKKPTQSAKEIPELRNLHRELAFNNKMGINVLGQKSELKKAMEKMRDQVVRKREEEEKKQNKSDLEMELEKRAQRLKELENVLTERNVPTSDDEFHRMHAKVNGRFASATS